MTQFLRITAIDLARVQGNPAAMIAGWREIGKMCGYYAPERKQIELRRGDNALRAQYDVTSDAELLEFAMGG